MFRSALYATFHLIRFKSTYSRVENLIHLPFAKSLLSSVKPSLPNYGFVRDFHTTPRRCLHPLLILFLKPFGRVVSIVSGKVIRLWWKRLAPEKKHYFKIKYFFNFRFWAITVVVISVGGGTFYFTHLQTTPITNRRRFIFINDKQMAEISELLVKTMLFAVKDKVIDPKNAVHIRVSKVIDRLVNSNMDVEKVKSQKWILHVIEDEMENASAFSNGHIFVFTGLLDIASNDDQLAFILGHEIAHVVLSHVEENLSFTGLVDSIMVLLLAIIWAVLPDVLAIVVQSIQKKISSVLMDLPFSRNLELEADEVGLEFVSKACYDVREASNLWRKWAAIEEDKALPEFLRTHPLHENRAKQLDKLMPKAIAKRKECNCPDLKSSDLTHEVINRLLRLTR